QIGRQRSAASDHEGGRPVCPAPAGDGGELRARPVRQGQRPETLGLRARQARGQEREEASQGSGSSKAGGADGPLVGHRRGVRATRLPEPPYQANGNCLNASLPRAISLGFLEQAWLALGGTPTRAAHRFAMHHTIGVLEVRTVTTEESWSGPWEVERP